MLSLFLGAFLVFNPSSLPAADRSAEIASLNSKAGGLFQAGNLDDAIAVWRKAVEIAEASMPDSSIHLDLLCDLSAAYYRAGSRYYPLVQAYLEQVVDTDPNRAIAYLILGDICYDNVEPSCAIGNYDLSLRLDPGLAYSERARKRMETLKAKSADPSNFALSLVKSTRWKYVYPAKIEIDLPLFIFYLTISEDSRLSRVDIIREDERMIYESIKYGPDMECNFPSGIESLSRTVDFSGDGFNDVKIACSSDSNGDIGYLYYLFHKGRLLFIPFVGGLLPDLAPGQGSEEIYLFGKPEKGGRPAVEAIYKSAGGRFVTVKRPEESGH